MDLRALLKGSLLLIAWETSSLSAIAFYEGFVLYVIYIDYCVLALVGGYVGWLVRNRITGHMLVLGSISALVTGTGNLVWSAIGMPADFYGFIGFLIVTLFSLPFALVTAILGGIVGNIARTKFTLNKPNQPTRTKRARQL